MVRVVGKGVRVGEERERQSEKRGRDRVKGEKRGR